jgi:hypothetical protein
MHLHPIPLLDHWAWQCPCGARSQYRYGLCRKCLARASWSRRKMRPRRVTRIRRVRRFRVEVVSD